MTFLMAFHIAAGCVALFAGAAAAAARKGSPLHFKAGNWFGGSMLILGASAAVLEPLRSPPGSPVGGFVVCYFVATGWVAARRRDGTTGWFEIAACFAASLMAGLMVWGASTGAATPAGTGPIFLLAGVCAIAALGDLNAILRSKLTAGQRLARHLWRMCFAFFMGTGSFFLGQQDVMPIAVQGSPMLFVLALAPFAIMAFWLVRIRFKKAIGRISLRISPPGRVLEAAK